MNKLLFWFLIAFLWGAASAAYLIFPPAIWIPGILVAISGMVMWVGPSDRVAEIEGKTVGFLTIAAGLVMLLAQFL